jgi:hypothetical protein
MFKLRHLLNPSRGTLVHQRNDSEPFNPLTTTLAGMV